MEGGHSWNSSNFRVSIPPLGEINCFPNPNCDNSADRNDPFASALTSLVSSPAVSNAGTGDGFVSELIGKLGSIPNSVETSPQSYKIGSTNNSCYTTPLNSPPKLNLMEARIGGKFGTGDSREGSSLSEQNPANSRKRKAIPRAKGPVKEDKVGRENDESSSEKRSKSDEDAKVPEAPKDYIHVRARRGQATDSHSLAERVRREKISERMKFLQDLVPGCNKVTGKAVVLDEIINYVQSLQRQVEFLSIKLATVNPRPDVNMEAFLTKDILQLQSNMFPDSSAPVFPYGLHAQQMPASLNGLQMPSTGLYGDSTPQMPSFWEDDLHSIVQMGFPQNQMQNFQGTIPTTQMKTEL